MVWRAYTQAGETAMCAVGARNRCATPSWGSGAADMVRTCAAARECANRMSGRDGNMGTYITERQARGGVASKAFRDVGDRRSRVARPRWHAGRSGAAS